MINANHHEVKFEGRLHRYIQNIPELADKAIMTKVYKCPAYAQLLTDGQPCQVMVGFKADIPGLGAGVNQWKISGNWTTAGNWTTGYSPANYLYSPLATLKHNRPQGPKTGYR